MDNPENIMKCSSCDSTTTYKEKKSNGELYDKWYKKDGRTLCKKCFTRIRYQERNAPPPDTKCFRCGSSETRRSDYGASYWHKSVYDPTKTVCSSCHITEVNETKTVSPETRRKMSESLKGKVHHSEEQKRKWSEQRKGQLNPFFGKKHTEKSLEEMSEGHKAWLSTHEHPNKGNHLSEESKNQMRDKKRYQQNKESALEELVRDFLKAWKVPFEKHVSFTIGDHRYRQVDIVVGDKLVIEVDGNWWHANPKFFGPEDKMSNDIPAKMIWAMDEYATKEIEKQGYAVLRIWESELTDDLGGVVLKLVKALKECGIQINE